MPLLDKKVFFAGYTFYVSENVYEPTEDSLLFAENLSIRKGNAVLDMGAGCGILGIIATEQASEVFAVDVNPYAIRCAKENAKANGVCDKMFFLQCDLFSSLRMKKKFDVILFNAPYLPSGNIENRSWLERAWSGGVAGRQIIDRFICKVSRHLTQDGCVFLMQSTLSNVQETLNKFEQNNLQARIVVKRDLPFFETILLVKAER